MDEQQLENRLTKLEEALDYIGEDLEDIKDTQGKIEQLALSVNTLAGEVKHLVESNTQANLNAEKNNSRICKEMEKLSARMTCIEEKPGKRWDGLVGTLITAIAAGLAGYALSILF